MNHENLFININIELIVLVHKIHIVTGFYLRKS